LLQYDASHLAVDWAERFADGEAQRGDEYRRLEGASAGAALRCEQSGTGEEVTGSIDEVAEALLFHGQITEPERPSVRAAYFANALLTLDLHDPFDPTFSNYTSLLLLPFLRDIFGNPFRSVSFSPAWRTDTAALLARQMYESREFSAMPILADALQDAGCDEPAILDHCRDPKQPHVRGCWVTDLVLDKQ
jgi:hypothetical protein